MSPKNLLYLVRALIFVGVAVAAWWSWSELKATIRAPVEAKLDAAVGANHAGKAATDAQNAGVDATKKEAEQRKARSALAAAKAGEPNLQRAREITAKPAPGETPLARAANRINTEFRR